MGKNFVLILGAICCTIALGYSANLDRTPTSYIDIPNSSTQIVMNQQSTGILVVIGALFLLLVLTIINYNHAKSEKAETVKKIEELEKDINDKSL